MLLRLMAKTPVVGKVNKAHSDPKITRSPKKGQNPISCMSDKLGFVQTAFLGMVLAYGSLLKVGFGFF